LVLYELYVPGEQLGTAAQSGGALECSLQPDTGGEITSTEEVDIRYVVTSLKGSAHIFMRTSIASAGR
jgi:hypothetical protein